MKNYPYRWFTNIATLLEKRDYTVYNVFLFSLFVASLRRFFEWALGGVLEPFPISFIALLTGFYWLSFFVFTSVLKLLVPQPWRVSINVILVGIFLGIFPPVIDLLASGPGFSYAYVWGVPSDFNWYLYNPALKIPLGEAVVLWTVILLTTLYVWYKTRSAARTLGALVLAYLGVLAIGGAAAGAATLITDSMGWEPTHKIALVNLLQVFGALLLYLFLQPRLARGLIRRAPAVLPYLLPYLAGSALLGVLSVVTLVYGVLALVVLLAVGAQRDALRPGFDRYADDEDLRFLSLTVALLLTALTAANSFALVPLLLLALCGLAYRLLGLVALEGRYHAPLLMVLVSLAAFGAGLAGAVEERAYGAPRWWISFLPSPGDTAVIAGGDWLIVAALGAVVAGGLFAAYLVRSKSPVMTAARAPRGYSTFGLLVFLLAITALRLFFDWVLGGSYHTLMLVSILSVVGRYWLAFFAISLVLARTTLHSWRRSAPGVAGVLSLAALPPFAEAIAGYSEPFYRIAPSLPEGWRWSLHYPSLGMGAGEALLWWALLLVLGAYVWMRTRSGWRTAATVGLVYLVAILVGVLPVVVATVVRELFGWPPGHRIPILIALQFVAALGVYLMLQPGLRRGLARRIPHALPFMVFCFLGSAFEGVISATTAIYATVLFMAGWIALGQNDYFDALEDGEQGRGRYLDLEDVRFLTVTAALGIAGLAAAHSTVTFLGFMAFVAFVLYSYPFYRGKRYFPTNLKIEGVWGFSAFVAGVLAAFEHAAYGAPRWWVTHSAPVTDPALSGPFDTVTIAAMFLGFGGFSLVAALKDYKDWRADSAAGVQTLYTIAAKRGWNLRKTHAITLGACSAAVASAPFLMAWAEKISWAYTPGGVAAAGLVWAFMWGPPSRRRFAATLLTLAAYFLYLVIVLV